ncbi:hypothetical protein E5F05_07295 [Deinococcus metallilatus]|uniref:Uncharacterized protein n=1 Tax=Deinococcus metallilatus TaxID=1211322 RepID=A0AAJ5K3I7_9DEIO|nr:hypothetical protein [Deinococcus metallilatus]MBB5297082.1 hypothetical protein [Deinococcus metallilatus]QBY07775.1 hypothetical protein E5F05_07295 [Deinococcus metallilatus]RXJ13475.1 hypothetical protein ERJ73_06130 [Deinococcus metallilatus]TLK22368.1 hypothetical protein FCS05_17870 [Deinococcus metallilatus]GMA17334.1 hypothetical protein GCM10025871_36650 [Deinococcus metallilatus]
MTRAPDYPDQPNRVAQTPQDQGQGEVVISGLDTGPSQEERENVTPTDEHARLTPMLPHKEPTDEDG